MATVVRGDFEWDEDKEASNETEHGVTFDEAALAMIDPRSVDYEDLVEPDRLITLAAFPRRAYPLHCIHRARWPAPHHQRSGHHPE